MNHMPDSPIINNQSLPPDEDEISLLDLGVVIAENLRLIVFGPLVVGLIALGLSFLITPTFTSRTSFLPPQQQQSGASALLSSLGAISGLAASAAGLKNPSDQYIALLKSVTVADRLIDRCKLMELYNVMSRFDARKILSDATKISAGKDGLIVVEVDDKSPKRAADIASAYVVELRTLLGTLALTEAQQRRAFFERQLEQTKVKLTAAELALNSIGVSANALKSDPKAAVENVARLEAQITAQEVKLASMRGYLTETAPEFRQAQLALAALHAQLQKSEAGGSLSSSAGGYIEKYRDFKYQ
jgi:tyrosine-protein kinase Etk/Wzc